MPPAFELIPAIDLLDGQVVRLEQGRRDRRTIYSNDPLGFTRRFAEAGARRLHVVDLNGAFEGRFANLDHIGSICRASAMRVELGGGIRTTHDARQAWDAGVCDVILGTRAVEDREFVRELLALAPDRVIVGIDARDGVVTTRGWVSAQEGLRAVDFAREMASFGCRRIIYTDIATDGMLSGPNLPQLIEIARTVPGVEVVASGGIACLADIESIVGLGIPNIVGAITGRALYDGRLDLAQALLSLGVKSAT